jgi:hypothetical protein
MEYAVFLNYLVESLEDTMNNMEASKKINPALRDRN